MASFERRVIPAGSPGNPNRKGPEGRRPGGRVIAAAEGGSARRWDLPAVFDTAREPDATTGRTDAADAETVPPATPAPPTAEELAAIRETARQTGFDAGLAAGQTRAAEELARDGEQLAALMRALSEPLAELDRQVTDELVGLACDIARQLVRRELAAEPGQIVAVVRETLALLPLADRQVSLQLHPEDAALVERVLAADHEGMPWRLEEDPLISRGGCRVLSGDSRIDATVESRLGAVIARVLGDDRHHESEP